MSITVLYVPAHGECEVRDIEPDLATFQQLVGGDIEAIRGPEWTAYLHTEGKLLSLTGNAVATLLAARLGWVYLPGDALVGVVVFCGPADAEGADTSLRPGVLQALTAVNGQRLELS